MRILVTGRNGQVATSLVEQGALSPGVESSRRAVRNSTSKIAHQWLRSSRRPGRISSSTQPPTRPSTRPSRSRSRAFAVNRDGAAAAAAAAARLGVPFIHLSTDYVYPGDKPAPYVENDETGPLGVYGQSKLAGEVAVRAAHPSPLILRTSWVYSPFGNNFVKTMLRVGRDRPVLSVVDDQTGNPTSALDIADAILRIAPGLAAGGTYHLCGSGEVTWCGFARGIFAVSAAKGGPNPQVKAITTAGYPTPASRPANSCMSMAGFSARFGFTLRPWQEAVAETVERLL